MSDVDECGIVEFLDNFRHRNPHNPTNEIVYQSIIKNKEMLKMERDNQRANKYWCYKRAYNIQTAYFKVFEKLANNAFYDAWCILEDIELMALGLSKLCDINQNKFNIQFIYKHTRLLQELFPYRYFFSPGWLIKEQECSICGKVIKLRESCGHEKGQLYYGEMCVYVITSAEILEGSLVTSPSQKYSVVFLDESEKNQSGETYSYHLIEYLIHQLKIGPFDNWELLWTERQYPHDMFPKLTFEDKCVCGSGEIYGKCCLQKEKVTMKHCEFVIGKAPKSVTEQIYYKNHKVDTEELNS